VIEVQAFLVLSALIIVTPGQDTALTIRNTITGGRVGGVLTAVGITTGLLIWVVATAAGLAALLVASETLFLALRIVGGAYLVWFGLRAWRDALRRTVRADHHLAEPPAGAPRLQPRAAYRRGLLSNLGNPKIAVFFTSLLPPFVPSGAVDGIVELGIAFAVMTVLWLTLIAFAVDRAGEFLRRTWVRRTLDAVLGTVFVFLGVRVATSAR
jgi:threonine/homoserine/homoserine lactone efflux protein